MAVDEPGAASSLLPAGVRHLDQAEAVFAAMLEGWTRQQRSRHLKVTTIRSRVDLVRRFNRYTGLYPWQWTPSDVEAWCSFLLSGTRPIEVSTLRTYQNEVGMFCDYLVDRRYEWQRVCQERFGEVPQQVFHEWNTVGHVADFEGRPGRRALTYDEVQTLFDAADDRAEQIRRRKRKGALAAMRDAVMLKVIYGFGLRRREACGLDLADLRRNASVPEWGRYGALEVRWGKSVRGGAPRRRTVLLVPEFDWVVDLLQDWVTDLRPRFGPGAHPALWVTERAGRVAVDRLDHNYAEIRQLAGLPEELTLHSLRHSYVTHLLEFGYPELFVQQQVGHSYAATTSIYSHVSDAYRNRLLTASLERQLAQGGASSPLNSLEIRRPDREAGR